MQRISIIFLFFVSVLLYSCTTIGSAARISSTSSICFFPERVLHNQDQTTFAISGYSIIKGEKKPCYFLLPKQSLDALKTEKGKIMLSSFGAVGSNEIKLSPGSSPPNFVSAAKIAPVNQTIAVGIKKSIHPQFVALLPFTLIVDVATLPLQLAAAKSLDFMN